MELFLKLKPTDGINKPLSKDYNIHIRGAIYNHIKNEDFRLSDELHGTPSPFVFNFFVKEYPVIQKDSKPFLSFRCNEHKLYEIIKKLKVLELKSGHKFDVFEVVENVTQLSNKNTYELLTPLIIKNKSGIVLEPTTPEYTDAVVASIEKRYGAKLSFKVLNLPKPKVKFLGENFGHKFFFNLSGDEDTIIKCLNTGIGSKTSYGFSFIKAI